MSVKNISLNELSYDVLELYRQNVLDTTYIDIRQIKYWVNSLRSKLLRQKFQKEPFTAIDPAFIQELNYQNKGIEMELVDSSVVSSLPSNRYYLRSTISIPNTIERIGGLGTFTHVGPADKKNEKFIPITFDHSHVFGSGKFNSSAVAFFTLGDRIYLVSVDKQAVFGTKYISCFGVFDNPVEAALITNPLYNDDLNYPISLNMVDDIKTFILNKEFRLNSKFPVDGQPANQEQLNKQE